MTGRRFVRPDGAPDRKDGKDMANIGIMGAGSWGTALALLLNRNGHQVTVWSISDEEVKMLS